MQSNKGFLLAIMCMSIGASAPSRPRESWYNRVTSFIAESIWRPLSSAINALFSQGRSTLVRLAALVRTRTLPKSSSTLTIDLQPPPLVPFLKTFVQPTEQDAVRGQASESDLLSGISVQPIDKDNNAQKTHVLIQVSDTQAINIKQSESVKIKSAQAVSSPETMYVNTVTKDDVTIGAIWVSEEKGGKEISYLKDNFTDMVLKYYKKGASIEQLILSLCEKIDNEFLINNWTTKVRGAGFILHGNLAWLFGGMGKTLETLLLKKTDNSLQEIFKTRQSPFAHYFAQSYKIFTQRNQGYKELDRFFGRTEPSKPYFIAQPVVTCLELQPGAEYYIVCSLDGIQDKISQTLREKNSLANTVEKLVKNNDAKALLVTKIVQSPASQKKVSLDISYALDQGDKKEMQDFLAIESDELGLWAGVFDGHDNKSQTPGVGFDVAQAAQSMFYTLVVKELKERGTQSVELVPEYTQKILRKVGLEVDNNVVMTTYPGGGTTLSGTFIDKKYGLLYVVNIGDSRTIIFDNSGDVIFRSHDHSVRTSAREKNRIRTMGTVIDPKERRIGGLIPSRSLGDKSAKILSNKAVLADADVTPLSLSTLTTTNKMPLYIVSASDGIWDMFKRAGSLQSLFQTITDIKGEKTIKDNLKKLVLSRKMRPKRKMRPQHDNRIIVVSKLQLQ